MKKKFGLTETENLEVFVCWLTNLHDNLYQIQDRPGQNFIDEFWGSVNQKELSRGFVRIIADHIREVLGYTYPAVSDNDTLKYYGWDLTSDQINNLKSEGELTFSSENCRESSNGLFGGPDPKCFVCGGENFITKLKLENNFPGFNLNVEPQTKQSEHTHKNCVVHWWGWVYRNNKYTFVSFICSNKDQILEQLNHPENHKGYGSYIYCAINKV